MISVPFVDDGSVRAPAIQYDLSNAKGYFAEHLAAGVNCSEGHLRGRRLSGQSKKMSDDLLLRSASANKAFHIVEGDT